QIIADEKAYSEDARAKQDFPQNPHSYSGALDGGTIPFNRRYTHIYPYTSFECRTMLYSVESFVRIGSGGNGPPRRELILSIAVTSVKESNAALQAADASFSNAISSAFEPTEGGENGRCCPPLTPW